jgi:nucleotide-binding universal stress UspA family protein
LLVTGDLDLMAGLYAIGVVGAIAINLGSCSMNARMPLKAYERAGMGLLAAVMVAIEITLAIGKPSALVFAVSVLGAGLGLRFITKSYLPARAARKAALAKARTAALLPGGEAGEFGTPAEELDMSKPKVLVATRGGIPLLQFAAKYARRMDGVLMVMFVRQVNVVTMGGGAMTLEEDEEARAVFRKAAELCRAAGVAMIPVYAVSPDVAYAILDQAATYSVDSVLMGVSRQGALLRALRGDVLTAVADHLPADISLLIHA